MSCLPTLLPYSLVALVWQVADGFVTADDGAKTFHLSPAQQMVLANEYGPDASPFFSAGQLSVCCIVYMSLSHTDIMLMRTC